LILFDAQGWAIGTSATSSLANLLTMFSKLLSSCDIGDPCQDLRTMQLSMLCWQLSDFCSDKPMLRGPQQKILLKALSFVLVVPKLCFA
jgi:hypothetical protein